MPGRKKVVSGAGGRSSVRSRGGRTDGEGVTHNDIMSASVRPDPELQRRSQLLWEDRTKSTRGPKAAFAPDEVVEAAMRIADSDGLAAVTMQAVSAQLGYSTMAIYRYFPSKEALYDAIVDAGMGLPPAPSGVRGDWRAEVTRWAHAKREMLCARPWLGELPFVAAPHGPNWMAWLEALAAPLSATGLNPADIGQMISLVDGYTRGASDTSISLARARARGVSQQEWAAAVAADLGRAVGHPRFPAFAAIITAPPSGPSRTMKESFDFGLQRLLDGVELYVSRASAQS